MKMAKSTHYFELSKTDMACEEYIKNSIIITYQIDHKRIQRLIHKMGLFEKRPKEKYHFYKGEVRKNADNIIDGDFSTTAP